MNKIKKIFLLLVTLTAISSCSLKVDFNEDESSKEKSKSYYVNHLYGDEAGQQELITVPNDFNSEKNNLDEDGIDYNFKFNDKQKKAFKQIKDGIKEYRQQIKIESGAVLRADINDFLTCVTFTMPEVHYILDNYGLYVDNDGYITEINLNYSCHKDQGEMEIYLLNQEVEKIVRGAEGLSDFEKLKYFHDQIIANCQYDSDAPNGHTAFGCLVDGKSVCDGYAKALYILCDRAGIPCIEVIGNGNDDGVIEPHSWNFVEINGNWYQIDVTWDDTDTDYISYDYFNISDEEMFKTHSISENKFIEYPTAFSNDENYFVKYGFYITDKDNTEDIIEKAVINSLKSSENSMGVKFETVEKYNQAVKKYFDKKSDGIFDIISSAEKKCNLNEEINAYDYICSDATLSITVKFTKDNDKSD